MDQQSISQNHQIKLLNDLKNKFKNLIQKNSSKIKFVENSIKTLNLLKI